MGMDYQKLVDGMEITMALFLPLTLGSYEEATTLVLMQMCSSGIATVAGPITASVFVLR